MTSNVSKSKFSPPDCQENLGSLNPKKRIFFTFLLAADGAKYFRDLNGLQASA